MAVFLSIDWDFFIALQDNGGVTQLPEGGSIPNAMLYDWGLGEGPTINSMGNYLWHSRAGHFRALGLDIEEEFNINPELGSVRPEEFMETMDRLAGGKVECPVFWADSHVHAYTALSLVKAWSGEPITVLHFDAHHDLGYKDRQIRKIRKEGIVDCGSWLLGAIELGLTDEVHVIYPDWRGLDEWDASRDMYWMPGAEKATARTWSDFLVRAGTETTDIVGAFVARSGGWTPPYLDEEFADFVEVLAHPRPWRSMEKDGSEVPDQSREAMVRLWSDEQVQEECDIRLEMLKNRQHPRSSTKISSALVTSPKAVMSEGGGI